MNVGIIGCGLIGHKRLRALRDSDRLVAVADVVPARAEALAKASGTATVIRGWHELVSDAQIETVIVSTTNASLAAITKAAVEAGKHVLVEKPAARCVRELEPVMVAANKAGVCVEVGFNYRFHPALLKARRIVDSGAIGELIFVRGRHGHGGRVGYEREWRADPQVAGGGELIDQGVHLIDLSRWFLGDLPNISGHVATYFWEMPVDDNAFLSLRSRSGATAWLHVSCTEWKNLFSFEIYGRHGKLQIDGLGGSYGLERLSFYQMLSQMGPPETTIWEYPGEDTSWRREFEAFAATIESGGRVAGGLTEAHAALEIVEAIYRGMRAESRDHRS